MSKRNHVSDDLHQRVAYWADLLRVPEPRVRVRRNDPQVGFLLDVRHDHSCNRLGISECQVSEFRYCTRTTAPKSSEPRQNSSRRF